MISELAPNLVYMPDSPIIILAKTRQFGIAWAERHGFVLLRPSRAAPILAHSETGKLAMVVTIGSIELVRGLRRCSLLYAGQHITIRSQRIRTILDECCRC